MFPFITNRRDPNEHRIIKLKKERKKLPRTHYKETMKEKTQNINKVPKIPIGDKNQ